MKIDIKVVFRPADLLRRLQAAPHIVEEEMGKALDDLMLQIAARAKRRAPKHRGALQQSLSPGGPGTLTWRRGLHAQVGSSLPEAAPMEYGTKPHWPPYAPIQDWVWLNRRKFSVQAPKGMWKRLGAGKYTEGDWGAYQQMERITFLVRRAIARRGLKERRYLRDSFEEVFQKAKRVVAHYANNIVRRVTGP